MTARTSKVDTYIDHEGPVAERYKWWGVYLIREKRRLQGIAEAVASGTPLAGGIPSVGRTPPAATTDLDDNQPAAPMQPGLDLPPDIETPDELLTRVDTELGIADALVDLGPDGDEQDEESKAHGDSVRDEQTISKELQKRKLSGRAALLGRRRRGQPDAEGF